MNIKKTEDKVVIEMTHLESMELRNAYRHAMNYWQFRATQVGTQQAEEALAIIARAYGITHNEIADVIGY